MTSRTSANNKHNLVKTVHQIAFTTRFTTADDFAAVWKFYDSRSEDDKKTLREISSTDMKKYCTNGNISLALNDTGQIIIAIWYTSYEISTIAHIMKQMSMEFVTHGIVQDGTLHYLRAKDYQEHVYSYNDKKPFMYNGTMLIAPEYRGTGMMNEFIRIAGHNIWQRMGNPKEYPNVIMMVGHLASPTSDRKWEQSLGGASVGYKIYRPNQSDVITFAMYKNAQGDRMTLISNKQHQQRPITSAL